MHVPESKIGSIRPSIFARQKYARFPCAHPRSRCSGQGLAAGRQAQGLGNTGGIQTSLALGGERVRALASHTLAPQLGQAVHGGLAHTHELAGDPGSQIIDAGSTVAGRGGGPAYGRGGGPGAHLRGRGGSAGGRGVAAAHLLLLLHGLLDGRRHLQLLPAVGAALSVPGVVAGACTDGLWHGGSGCTSQLSTAQVGISQLHALDVLLLSHHHVAELHQDGQGHAGLVEGDLALAAVHQALAHVLQADVGDEVAHHLIVHAGSKGAEEINGLAGKVVHQGLHISTVDIIIHEDAHAHANAILAGGVPVELLHASITNQGGVQGREIVTGGNDWHTGDVLGVVHAWQLHVGGVICNVHQGGVHHLVVHGVLGALTHATSTSIQIVDEQGAHLALLHNV
mmetsp:Transcript_15786/g.42866  ORF Transcript_15786/g.42866 Transcript_15786/m.42866 type:complete len:397 (+) Transcript_15786:291-1481(+)